MSHGHALIGPGSEVDGRYRVRAVLGAGSMGTVYAAERVGGGGEVAVKVLHRQFVRNGEALLRFAREARAASDVGHPGVVPVIDRGDHQGTPYLAMPLLHGETLARRLDRERRLPRESSCRIVGHVLATLAATHAAGIVHRDLKPDNVFLEEACGATRVRLLDFGVSKFRRAVGPAEFGTLEGTILGTPGYMAPEQWMGRLDVDHRADLFAAGALLYELLCGRVPYGGEHQGELFLEVVRGTRPPELPSRLSPDVPAALDRVLLRALEREREERYGSAREFLEALRPFGAEGIEVVSLPPAAVPSESCAPPPRRSRRRRRSPARPTRLTAFVVGLLGSFSAGVLLRWPSPPARPPPQVRAVVVEAAAARLVDADAGVAAAGSPPRVAQVGDHGPP